MRLARLLATLLLLAAGSSSAPAAGRRLASLLAGSELSFEALHSAAIADQETHYMEPLESAHTRPSKSLNGLYDFCFDPEAAGFTGRWSGRPLADSCGAGNFYRMPVPSAFNEILSNESAKSYMGWFWYQTEVGLWPLSEAPVSENQLEVGPGAGPSSKWLLQFDSINYLALIWAQALAGGGGGGGGPEPSPELVGSHVGGHLPVVVDVSELARNQSRLRLTIAVSNQLTQDTIPSGRMENLTALVGRPLLRFKPDFDFFHFAGLLGDVQLVRLPALHISSASLRPLRPLHPAGRLQLRVCLAGLERGAAQAPQPPPPPPLAIEAVGGPNELWLEVAGRRLAKSGQRACLTFKTNWPTGNSTDDWARLGRRASTTSLRLWRKSAVGSPAIPLDLFQLAPAGRRASMSQRLAQTGGQLQGFGMHQEQLFSGRSMGLAAIMKDLYLVRRLGANVIRTSHYPYSSAYLEACDELGIMVVAECAAVGLRSFGPDKLRLHKQLLKEMMLRDWQHPSIVMWSVANEPASQEPAARAYFESLLAFARTELAEFTTDAGRPLTAALAGSHQADTLGDLLDVLMVNRYYGWYEFTGALEAVRPALLASLAGWADKYAGKPLLVAEFGAEALAGLHSGEPFSEEFQRRLIEEHERVFDELAAANRSRLHFLGAMIWNFADFSTHESLLRPGGNRKGLFTVDRRPKMAAESVGRIFRARAGAGIELLD